MDSVSEETENKFPQHVLVPGMDPEDGSECNSHQDQIPGDVVHAGGDSRVEAVPRDAFLNLENKTKRGVKGFLLKTGLFLENA